MLVLGLILILLSAGTVIGVLASGTDDKAVLYGDTLHMPTLVVFLAGAATLLVFIMGLELVRSGIRRANENRKTKKRLRKLEAREEQRTEPGSAPATPREGDDTGTDSHPGTRHRDEHRDEHRDRDLDDDTHHHRRGHPHRPGHRGRAVPSAAAALTLTATGSASVRAAPVRLGRDR